MQLVNPGNVNDPEVAQTLDFLDIFFLFYEVNHMDGFLSKKLVSLITALTFTGILSASLKEVSSAPNELSFGEHEDVSLCTLNKAIREIHHSNIDRISVFIDIDDTLFSHGEDFNLAQKNGNFDELQLLYPDLWASLQKLGNNPQIDVHFLTASSPWSALLMGNRLVFSPVDFSPYDQWEQFPKDTSLSQVRAEAVHTVLPDFVHDPQQPARLVALEWAPISRETFPKASLIPIENITFQGTVNGDIQEIRVSSVSEIFASRIPIRSQTCARIFRKHTEPDGTLTFAELAAITVEQAGIIFYVAINEQFNDDKARALLSFYQEQYGDASDKLAVISIDDRPNILAIEAHRCQAANIPFYPICVPTHKSQ